MKRHHLAPRYFSFATCKKYFIFKYSERCSETLLASNIHLHRKHMPRPIEKSPTFKTSYSRIARRVGVGYSRSVSPMRSARASYVARTMRDQSTRTKKKKKKQGREVHFNAIKLIDQRGARCTANRGWNRISSR